MNSARRSFAIRLVVSVVCAMAIGGLRPAAAQDNPNILLILTDDVGWGDLRSYNPDSRVSLPTIESLAADGLLFTDAHTSAAKCAPVRYSVISGNYHWRGSRSFGQWNYRGGSQILPGQLTLGHVLQQAGYSTAFIGKYHMGGEFYLKNSDRFARFNTPEADIDFSRKFRDGPTETGFDYSFLALRGIQDSPYAFFENDLLLGNANNLIQWTKGDYGDAEIAKDGIGLPDWNTREVGPTLVEQTVEFIDVHHQSNLDSGTSRPFFVHYNTEAVHSPWKPPITMRGTPILGASQFKDRTDLLVEIDVTLNILQQELAARGLLENTLIIFTSDNGGGLFPGEINNGHDAVGGLRGNKGMIFEGGHRVPLIIKWGDGSANGSAIQPGATSSALISVQDIYATLASLVNVTIPEDQGLDSFNMLPLILGQSNQPIRDNMIHEADTSEALSRVPRHFAFREGDWKLIIDDDNNPEQLYNLATDLAETNNLINQASEANRVDQMFARFTGLRSAARTTPSVQINAAPIVEAGNPQTIASGSVANLTGSVIDDGLALPLNINWSVWWSNTAGNVTFGDTSEPMTTVSIDTAGIYDLKLEASDPDFTVDDLVTITVITPPPNTAPVAEAGNSQTVPINTLINLSGSFSDDGVAGPVTTTWSVFGAPPGNTSFSNVNSLTTGVSFDTPGTYTLQLKVDDTQFSHTDAVNITVTAAPVSRSILFVTRSNPVTLGDVNVVAQIESLGHSVTVVDDDVVTTADAAGRYLVVISSTVLSGKVNTKFRDTPIPVITWEGYLFDDLGMTGPTTNTNYGALDNQQGIIVSGSHPLSAGLSGPIVIASNTNKLTTNSGRATIFGYASGDTMFSLNAPARRVGFVLGDSTANTWTAEARALFDAAINWALDSVNVVNAAPIVEAGDPQAINVGSIANLTGSVIDDGVALPLNINWSVWSSDTAGNVTFGDTSAPMTTVSIDTPGIYDLKLEASDPDFTVDDLVTITVITPPPNTAPVAEAGSPQTAQVNTLVNLAGSFSDDGIAGPLTTSWSVVGVPPGNVAFTNANSLTTSASFAAPGTYTLQLEVDDTQFSDTDTVNITVTEAPVSRNTLFVARSNPVTLGDINVVAQLESLGHSVTVVDDNVVTTADAAGRDLIVISSTVLSGRVNTRFRDTPIPVITWEGYLFDDLGMTGPTTNANYGTLDSQQSIIG